MVAEVGATGQVLEIGFAKSLQSSHRVAANRQAGTSYPNQEVHLLQVCFSVTRESCQPAFATIASHTLQGEGSALPCTNSTVQLPITKHNLTP